MIQPVTKNKISMSTQAEKTDIPRPAATVILIRELADELQVYLLKRSTKSGFMAGNYVFPGGVLDPGDRDACYWQPYVDLNPAELTQRLAGKNLNDQEAQPYGIAAIRETFEEAGVLLGRCEKESTAELEKLNRMRQNIETSENWLQDLVATGKWMLSFSGLYPWSHWITPAKMKKRFDTRFFIAPMPPDQVCRPDNRETTHGVWISPHKGLAGNQSGEIPLSPPTVVTLHELLSYQSLDDLVQHAVKNSWGEALMPRLTFAGEDPVIVEPWDPKYHHAVIHLTAGELAKNRAGVGQPFSRLWNDGGIWRPVKASSGND